MTTAAATTNPLFARHRETLERAVDAVSTRAYFSAYPESPSPRVYGESAAADGKKAFEAWQGGEFPLSTPGASGVVATERSPFGFDLGISYPHVTKDGLDELLGAARSAMSGWRGAGIEGRAGICLEILARLHERVFELANSVQHTSGQAFVMAFQAGGTHALDRALESVAVAYTEMSRQPVAAYWEKPAGKGEPLRMQKSYTLVGRGVALVIGCNTFPTWNSWPGLFASLVCGNAVVVKPHPHAVLPLAITVQVAQEVLREQGLDPNLVTLAAEAPGEGLAADLAVRPEIRLIDFTGSNAFGEWLESHARQALVYTEKAGVNTVVIDSTDSFRGMCDNLAFSLVLYTGQMCTTPQNLYVPADGIDTDEGHKSLEEVGQGIAEAIERLVGEDARAVELLGAIVNDGVLQRLEQHAGDGAGARGNVVLASRAITHPSYPEARVRTPALVALEVADEDTYCQECFGPVAYVIRTASTQESVEVFRRTVIEHGAMTAAVYSTSEQVLEQMREAALDAAVALSENLTSGVYVNQSAAFSDYHGTGGNPAANSAYTDTAYIAGRFRVIQSRRHVPAAPAPQV